jgi:protein-tyrosine phosphatase
MRTSKQAWYRHVAFRIPPTLGVMRGFVDIHSHMVPSGDDGVRSVDEAVELVLEAGSRGTAVQYATPHAMDRHPFTDERRRRVTAAREQIRARLEGRVDFRVGWEISPERWLLAADPRMLSMEGLDACLLELPLPHTGPRNLDTFVACGDHIAAAGLVPIMGHPERCDLVHGDLDRVTELRGRGWLAQVNASSLLGRHGPDAQDAGWTLVESGRADIVASDGHRAKRPPWLDVAFAAVAGRIGREQALSLFTGAALAPLATLPLPRAEPA